MSEVSNITPEILIAKLKSGIPDITICEAVDESDGCGAKFEIKIVSEAFTGKKLLQRHRMVHSAIAAERESIHALTLITKTPTEFEG